MPLPATPYSSSAWFTAATAPGPARSLYGPDISVRQPIFSVGVPWARAPREAVGAAAAVASNVRRVRLISAFPSDDRAVTRPDIRAVCPCLTRGGNCRSDPRSCRAPSHSAGRPRWRRSGNFVPPASTVKPRSLISRIVRPICCTITGARPSVGSSSSSIRAPVRRMRAIASICCSPPDSRVPCAVFARSLRLGNNM